MAHCDYWWLAGGVEWCDMLGSNCRCGGWEESCLMRRRRKKCDRQANMMMGFEDEERASRRDKHGRHNDFHR